MHKLAAYIAIQGELLWDGGVGLGGGGRFRSRTTAMKLVGEGGGGAVSAQAAHAIFITLIIFEKCKDLSVPPPWIICVE